MNQRTYRTPILFLLITFISVPLLAMDAPGYRKLVCGQSNPDLIPFQKLIALIKDIDSNEEQILKAINQNKHLCTVCDFANNTLLIEATKNGMLSVIKHIITIGNELGLDSATAVNHAKNVDETILSIAVGRNYIKIVEYLLTLDPSQEIIRHAIHVVERKKESPEKRTIIALLESKLKPEQPQEHAWQMPHQQAPQQNQIGLPNFGPYATSRQTLGLPNTATVTEAKCAYRKLALIYHPDKFEENRAILAERGITTKEQATAAFQKISNAWDQLNPNK